MNEAVVGSLLLPLSLGGYVSITGPMGNRVKVG